MRRRRDSAAGPLRFRGNGMGNQPRPNLSESTRITDARRDAGSAGKGRERGKGGCRVAKPVGEWKVVRDADGRERVELSWSMGSEN